MLVDSIFNGSVGCAVEGWSVVDTVDTFAGCSVHGLCDVGLWVDSVFSIVVPSVVVFSPVMQPALSGQSHTCNTGLKCSLFSSASINGHSRRTRFP